MAIVTTTYEMFIPRRRRIGTGSAIEIGSPPPPSAVTGGYPAQAPGSIGVNYPTPSDPKRSASFAFWSVSGSAVGDFTSGDPALVAQTGSGPMSVTAWYVLDAAPGGDGPTELETDAFLISENAFIDPTPIASVTPAGAWDQSDVDEFVLTADEASDVQALDVMGGYPTERFESWYSIEGGAVPSGGRLLHVPVGDNGVAIATFRVPPGGQSPVLSPVRGGEISVTLVGGVAVDGPGWVIVGGMRHPVDPWGPLLAALTVLLAAQSLDPSAAARVQLDTLRSMGMTIENMTRQIATSAGSQQQATAS